MSPALRLRRLDSIRTLLQRLDSSSPGVLGDVLDALLDATPALAAAAFDGPSNYKPRAERRLQSLRSPDRIRQALATLSERVFRTGLPMQGIHTRAPSTMTPAALACLESGAKAWVALPLRTASRVQGVIVLLFRDPAMLDEETLRYMDTIARLAALAPESCTPEPESLVAPRKGSDEEGGIENDSVLLVDDDPVFSRSLQRLMGPRKVRTAESASEAEIALLDPSYAPDLVVCDVFLPGANGNILHARVSELRPEIAARFVFVTGGALGGPEADYLRGCGCRTLFKPLDLESLTELLERRSA